MAIATAWGTGARREWSPGLVHETLNVARKRVSARGGGKYPQLWIVSDVTLEWAALEVGRREEEAREVV